MKARFLAAKGVPLLFYMYRATVLAWEGVLLLLVLSLKYTIHEQDDSPKVQHIESDEDGHLAESSQSSAPTW